MREERAAPDLEKVRDIADRVGVFLPRGADERLLEHLRLVREMNPALGLVADASPEELLCRHLADSLVGLRVLDVLAFFACGNLSVADVGTGGGFPGLVVAAVRPWWQVFLIDSRRKKIGFILKVKESLKLDNARPIRMRAENLALSAGSDVLTARAVASATELVSRTSHLVKCGGHSLWWKGAGVLGELRRAQGVMKERSIGLVARYPYRLPGEKVFRSLVLAAHADPGHGRGEE